jgi:hypothetical protein
VNAKSTRELAHALHRIVASLADNVCCAEVFSERDAIGMASEHDDLLRA